MTISDFSMAAGEFIESFGGDTAAWDCVASCFFLDTAHNVLEVRLWRVAVYFCVLVFRFSLSCASKCVILLGILILSILLPLPSPTLPHPQYLECIARILKPGGCLINIGPLLYHYSDVRDELSVDLAWDEIKMALPHLGLRLVLEEQRVCQYACNPHSMFSVQYATVFFVAVKDAL